MVRWVALFWGFVAFFPVGLNYTAFVLLGVTMAWEGGLGERLARLRQTPYWWPAWAFLGWAALALLLGPHYPETASNALHALRIVLTLALALALARDEALWALRGFVLGLVVSLLLAGLNEAVALRRTLEPAPLDIGHPLWREGSEIDLEQHVIERRVRAPGGDKQLFDLVAALHAEPLPRERPLWQFCVIDGLADGSLALHTKIHHALLDGQGATCASWRWPARSRSGCTTRYGFIRSC